MTDPAVHVVSCIEVMPQSADMAAALLAEYAGTVLQQTGRPDHFAIVETWSEGHAVPPPERFYARLVRMRPG